MSNTTSGVTGTPTHSTSNSGSASGIANKILNEHKLTALFAKVPGGADYIEIGLRLNQTLSPNDLAKLPSIIIEIASKSGIAAKPNVSLAELMQTAGTITPNPTSDTATLSTGTTRAEIVIASAIDLAAQESNTPQTIADEILRERGFSEYGIKVYVKPCRAQEIDKPQSFVTFTSDEDKPIEMSKKDDLDNVLKEIMRKLNVSRIAYSKNFIGQEAFTIKLSSL